MNNSRVGGIVFLIVSCLYGYFGNEIPLDFWSQQETFDARSMPRLLAAAGIVASVLLIVTPVAKTDWSLFSQLRWQPAVLLLILMSAYGFLMEFLGFAVSTILFLSGAFVVLGERKPLRILLVSLSLALGFWLLMDQLGIYLLPGSLFEDLIALTEAPPHA
ncbi:MAG: tripartite tricarboxylate transporter TctB family protein [Pseudomonadales bacterium]